MYEQTKKKKKNRYAATGETYASSAGGRHGVVAHRGEVVHRHVGRRHDGGGSRETFGQEKFLFLLGLEKWKNGNPKKKKIEKKKKKKKKGSGGGGVCVSNSTPSECMHVCRQACRQA